MNSRHYLFASSMLAAAALIACDKEQTADYPTGTGGYGASYTGGYGASYAQGGYGATAAQGGAGAAYTGGAGGGTTTAGNMATALPPAGLMLVTPVLQALAQKETAGRQPDGAPFGGNFQQGQILEQPITLQPGRCYTVVGLGMGITELDVEIVVSAPPAPEWVAATDNQQGPQAVLGGGSNCFKNPLPVGGPAKVRIRATGGNGLAAAQVFSS